MSRNPDIYKAISISLYCDDIAPLEQLTDSARNRGRRKVSKSDTIRRALEELRKQEAKLGDG